MSVFIGHTSHDRELGGCGSSDAVAVYEDDLGKRNAYCFSCQKTVRKLPEGELLEDNVEKKGIPDKLHFNQVKQLSSGAIKSRGITEETAKLYGVKVQYSTETREPIIAYFPYYKKGEISGYKLRDLRAGVEHKNRFDAVGDMKNVDMFGQHLIGRPGKMIVITEGELDCLSAYQIFKTVLGKDYRVVSIPNGANKNSLKRHLEFLERFESVKLCFDQDEVGREAAKGASSLFQIGKCTIMQFDDEKDANDLLMKDKSKYLIGALRNAKSIHIDGIISGSSTWDRLKNRPPVQSIPYPAEWEELQEKTYGRRLGELDTWTSGSGAGKTQIFRELMYDTLKNTEDSIGVIELEAPLEDSVEALMSLELNKRIHLPDVRETVTEEELYTAWKNTSGTNRVHYYDHFGSVDDQSLVQKIRYLATGLDCKWIFLDHLSIVVSEFASEGGERERIDTAMSRLKKLTQELNIWIGLIVHLRKGEGGTRNFEGGAVPTLDDLRGSGSIKQLSNSVFATARNQQATSDIVKNTSSIHVLKCRFTGDTGPAGYLYFDRDTGRLTALPQEEEEGMTNDD